MTCIIHEKSQWHSYFVQNKVRTTRAKFNNLIYACTTVFLSWDWGWSIANIDWQCGHCVRVLTLYRMIWDQNKEKREFNTISFLKLTCLHTAFLFWIPYSLYFSCNILNQKGTWPSICFLLSCQLDVCYPFLCVYVIVNLMYVVSSLLALRCSLITHVLAHSKNGLYSVAQTPSWSCTPLYRYASLPSRTTGAHSMYIYYTCVVYDELTVYIAT